MIDLLKRNALCVEAARQAAKQTDDQHKLINRYKDIAAKLCDPPLNCDRPGQWHGYIPPAYDGQREDGSARPNTSPVRVQLMAILEEAAERADGERRPA